MSGGHYEYSNNNLSSEMFNDWRPQIGNYNPSNNGDPMHDPEVSALTYDILALIHSLDWAECGDTDMEDYAKDLKKFRDKWLNSNGRQKHLEKLIKTMFDDTYNKCMSMIGNQSERKAKAS